MPRRDLNPRYAVPRAAYIHVPFCRHRCGYCNFTLVAGRDDLVDRYLSATQQEMSRLEQSHEVDTIYFGGGTPSHLAPRELQRLLDQTRDRFPSAPLAEISLEANPLDVSRSCCELLASAGVTRLSLGVQSFSDRKLTVLERDHRRADIERAAELAASYFPAWSLDLIFGVPGETLQEWRHDLASALQLNPPHISVYGLTWERGTTYWSRRLKGCLAACDDDVEREMFELVLDTLGAAGFLHYEVSNFARPGYRCRHNEVYWTGRTYFGIGPGAARYVRGRREVNHRSTTTYIRRVLAGESPTAEAEELSPEDAARERLVFGLRRLDGLDEAEFRDETGFELVSLGGDAMLRFVRQGWLEWNGPRLQLTRAGLLISDALWPELVTR